MIKDNKFLSFFRIANYCFWLFLLIVAIYDLFFVPYRSIIWFIALFALISVYFFFRKIPLHAHLFLSLIVLLNIIGEV